MATTGHDPVSDSLTEGGPRTPNAATASAGMATGNVQPVPQRLAPNDPDAYSCPPGCVDTTRNDMAENRAVGDVASTPSMDFADTDPRTGTPPISPTEAPYYD